MMSGVVVHRQMSGLQNLMEPCDLQLDLQLRDPKGSLYRCMQIEAKSLLTVFTFDLGSEARTGMYPPYTCELHLWVLPQLKLLNSLDDHPLY